MFLRDMHVYVHTYTHTHVHTHTHTHELSGVWQLSLQEEIALRAGGGGGGGGTAGGKAEGPAQGKVSQMSAYTDDVE